MSDRKSIETRIAELRAELARVEGRPAEVYSRIVGYYRSVRNWNAGKRSEYDERSPFAMPQGIAAMPQGIAAMPLDIAAMPVAAAPQPVAAAATLKDAAAGRGMLVFTRAACPACPPVASYVAGAGIAATFVDVDREDGLELARHHGVMATPTVLGFDAHGQELFRALDLGQLKERLGTARV